MKTGDFALFTENYSVQVCYGNKVFNSAVKLQVPVVYAFGSRLYKIEEFECTLNIY